MLVILGKMSVQVQRHPAELREGYHDACVPVIPMTFIIRKLGETMKCPLLLHT